MAMKRRNRKAFSSLRRRAVAPNPAASLTFRQRAFENQMVMWRKLDETAGKP
jgi:hypothetical protein